MANKPNLPTWPEFAKTYARNHLAAVQALNEAIAAGKQDEVREWRPIVRKGEAFMRKNGITLRA